MAKPRQHHTRSRAILRLFRCDWPNGDVSFVLANDEDDAICELDEVAAAERSMLTEVFTFQLHLALKKRRRTATSNRKPEWAFVLEGFGDVTAEYMDLATAVARKKSMGSSTEAFASSQVPSADTGGTDKPLVQMNDIEFRNVFDNLERGPDSLLGAMLSDARTQRSDHVIRTSAVVLVLPSGEERPLAAFSEYGDDEGRESAACCLRYCAEVGALTPNERLERLLLETRFSDLTSTRIADPVAPDSGFGWLEALREGDNSLLREEAESLITVWKERLASARKWLQPLLISVGVLTLPEGTKRSFCENGELGDNGGRMAVADNIRTSRRVGLLREGETLTRYMLEIHLQPLLAILKLDALREDGKKKGDALS